MERFAFKVDKVLKANLYKICRLCGIDNPDKIPILKEDETDVVDVDAEPELSQKIQDCIGFQICKDDKMPQMICSLCADKINDFFEFREMCYATNIQTRKLLGLKELPRRDPQIKVEVKSEVIVNERRSRKRKSEETDDKTEIKVEVKKSKVTSNFGANKKRMQVSMLKQNNETKPMEFESLITEVKNEQFSQAAIASAMNAAQNSKLKVLCKICNERFTSRTKLERHKTVSHSPNIPRYICTTCDETLKSNNDIKSHQLWHKLSKTPYTCGLCRESLMTTNLFTRHLRDHSQRLSTPIAVLDRECAQCHLIFCTNFLFNTHTCAVRTRKCGGCNKQIKSEIEYKYHTANCDKAYLVATKHICAPTDAVCIKNENDVEAAKNAEDGCHVTDLLTADSLTGLPVHLENNSCANTSKNCKKGTKKGLSKKDLKRVDDLLKSTMDTLVSIKHEPEMHVDIDAPNSAYHIDNNVTAIYNENNDDADDFHNRDDSDDDDNNDFNASLIPITQMEIGNDIIIKQEPIDIPTHDAVCLTAAINVKKELPDSGYEDSSNTIASAAKVPVLKLKITKEHGMLNSSLVDENSASREKKKKKKKRKDTEKCAEQTDNIQNTAQSPATTPEHSSIKTCELPAMPLPGIIRIKQERLDDDYEQNIPAESNSDTIEHAQAESTVMTSIPIMQFQISCVSSGVEFNESETEKEEMLDIKPNRAELDRWLKMNNATTTGDEIEHHNSVFRNNATDTELSKELRNTSSIPKIVAVSSGVDVLLPQGENDCSTMTATCTKSISDVRIKAEPSDDGYEEQQPTFGSQTNDEHESGCNNHINPKDNTNDDQTYMNSINYSNVNIKQEKDIDISEPQMTTHYVSDNSYNRHYDGIGTTKTSRLNSGATSLTHRTTVATELGNENEEEDMVTGENIEKREYRELKSPPPLCEANSDSGNNQVTNFNLRITHVRSQVEECAEKPDDLSVRSHNYEKNEQEIPQTVTAANAADTTQDNTESKLFDSNIKTTSLEIIEPTENLLKAKPNQKETSPLPSAIAAVNEEQQNILNSEVLAANEAQNNTNSANATSLSHTEEFRSTSAAHTGPNNILMDCNAISQVDGDNSSTNEKLNENNATTEAYNEETENFINENMDTAVEHRNQDAVDLQPGTSSTTHNNLQRALLLDDRNVNEIAENNNNANIERELLDDGSSSNILNNSTIPSPRMESENDEDIRT